MVPDYCVCCSVGRKVEQEEFIRRRRGIAWSMLLEVPVFANCHIAVEKIMMFPLLILISACKSDNICKEENNEINLNDALPKQWLLTCRKLCCSYCVPKLQENKPTIISAMLQHNHGVSNT